MTLFLRFLFWFALLGLGFLKPLIWVHQHGVLVHRPIASSSIVARNGAAYAAAAPAFPFMDRLTDSSDKREVSDLRLFDGPLELGPAHTSLEEVASRGHGAFADWEQGIVFSAPDNSNPRHNGHVYTAAFRLYPSRTGEVLLAAAACLLALVAAECVTIFRMRPWWPGRWTPAQTRFAALTGAAYGITGATLYLLAAGFSVHAPLPPDNMTPNEGSAFTATLPRQNSVLFKSYSDADSGWPRSNLVLFEDGSRLGPAHSPHIVIRSEGGGAYSHWGDGLVFSSSDGSDPRSNGRTYRVAYRRFLDPRVALALLLLCGGMVLVRWQPRSALRRSPRVVDGRHDGHATGLRGAMSTLARPASLARFGGLVAVYTVALIVLYASLVARKTDTGAVRINFEYKVF